MKRSYLAVVALSLAVAWPAVAAINPTQEAAHRVEASGTVHEAKFKWPKIHKCRPIKNGVECEIKTSELQGCRGTMGMTSCSFPPPNALPREFKPRPAGPDTGGPGRVAPPSGKIPKDYRPPRHPVA